jgi:triphosphoribosyl-dephospho-CoA synthase
MFSTASPEAGGRGLALAQAYVAACRLELRALKPGNVHRHAAGHGMTVDDFERSAQVSAAPLAAPGRPVGERMRKAIAATHEAVGCNTNLGIVLLAGPLMAAAETAQRGHLRDALAATLAGLTIADAADAYEAIRIAAPAGLGRAAEQDVASPPSVDLRQAMALAAERDRIARQYADGYRDVYEIGVARLREARRAKLPDERAATLAYMNFLAAFPDSHLLRKHGATAAEEVRREAAAFVARNEYGATALLAFDGRLKQKGLNPGTSADLTVASLLALACEDMLST